MGQGTLKDLLGADILKEMERLEHKLEYKEKEDGYRSEKDKELYLKNKKISEELDSEFWNYEYSCYNENEIIFGDYDEDGYNEKCSVLLRKNCENCGTVYSENTHCDYCGGILE